MSNSKPNLIRFHSLVPYDRGAKGRWLLSEMGIDYDVRWLDREKNENESPAFLRLNPMGRVPVLEMDDVVIFESGAICTYLAERFIDQGLAPALNSPDRAKYLQWMYFADSQIDQIQTRIMIVEDFPAGELQQKKQASLLSDLADIATTLDQALSQSDYLVGNRFSAADICVGYHLYWLGLWSELKDVLQKFPRVTSYMERLKAMPSAVKADVFSYEE